MRRKVVKSMFPTYDKIKELARKNGISINSLEEKLGYSRNTIYNMKKSAPNIERVAEIADFFGVSTDYLLGRTDVPSVNKSTNITTVDFRELAKGVMLFDGKKLTEDDIDFLSTVLEAHLKTKRD